MTQHDQTIKDYKRQIRMLQVENTQLANTINELKDERAIFHEHFITRFQWWAEYLRKGLTPDLVWLIRDDAVYLQRVSRWL